MNKYCLVGHIVTIDDDDMCMSAHLNWMASDYPSESMFADLITQLKEHVTGNVIDCFLSIISVEDNHQIVIYNYMDPQIDEI